MDLHADLNDLLKNETFRILLALLPGLVTASIVYALTVRQALAPLERVIQALLYTFIANFSWVLTVGVVNCVIWSITFFLNQLMTLLNLSRLDLTWSPSPPAQLIGLGVWGVIWGFILTWVINCGRVHNLLAWTGITKRASRPNEWYDAFYRYEHDYVVVHLRDGRRIFGWPRLYPDLPDQGHLVLEAAEWLPVPRETEVAPLVQGFNSSPDINPQSSAHQSLEADGRNISQSRLLLRIMIPATEIQFIEFVPMTPSGMET